MERSGTEILIQAFARYNVDTVFGYPGACVISILDELFCHKEIRQILVRHEQGAVHAACGYARLSNKPGVVIVTSGPGATNTATGIADAFYGEVPMIVITGQVSSGSIGTDAFQEIDMPSMTAPITKWNYQIRRVGEMAEIFERAFAIATADPPGPVLLDITKDAQTGRTEYAPNDAKPYSCTVPVHYFEPQHKRSENRFYDELLQTLEDAGKDIVLVLDKALDDFFREERFCYNQVLKSGAYGVPGFGLPAAIGAKYAAPDKTICLVAGTLEFQATVEELGVIKQQGTDVKIILLDQTATTGNEIKNPDFMLIASAYKITGCKIGKNDDLHGAIQRMLNSSGSYILYITT